MDDLISRQAAIDALWKALYEYEDETEKKFQESEDLDIQDWIQHRIFVQNMSDIDRQTILNLPSAQPDTEKICARIKAEAIKRNVEYMKHGDRYMLGFVDGMRLARRIVDGTIDDPVYFTLSGE